MLALIEEWLYMHQSKNQLAGVVSATTHAGQSIVMTWTYLSRRGSGSEQWQRMRIPVPVDAHNQNWDRIFKKQDTKSTPSTSNDVTANVGC
jgi:hypothetical protein